MTGDVKDCVAFYGGVSSCSFGDVGCVGGGMLGFVVMVVLP